MRTSSSRSQNVKDILRTSNILLVQLGDIGDVVLTTPTIRAMKENYPDACVSILVRKPFGDILFADPNLHEVIETEKTRGKPFRSLQDHAQLIHHIRRAHYDLVIDLRTGDRGAILSLFSGAKTRVGRKSNDNRFMRGLIFNRIVSDPKSNPQDVHPGADQSLHIVREIGINIKDSTPKLFISPIDLQSAKVLLAESGIVPGTRVVTINPFSRWKYKEWSDQKWGGIIDQLWKTRSISTALIGSSEEVDACSKIVAGRESHTFNLSGKTTLGELSALLSMSTLHLGVDSAAPHIAAAVGIPSLTLFGPSNWRSWTRVDELHRVVTSNMTCVPCNLKGCSNSGMSRCLDDLEVDDVWKPIDELLELIFATKRLST